MAWEPGDPLHLPPIERITGREPGVAAVRLMFELTAENFYIYSRWWCDACAVGWEDQGPLCWSCGQPGSEARTYGFLEVA